MRQLEVAELRTEARAMARRLNPSILVECRLIGCGDAAYLTVAESVSLAGAVEGVRNASGTARAIARDLLSEAGCDETVELLPQRPNGPIWPRSFLGSLAHDAQIATAAVAPRNALRGLGIDVEPAEPLPRDIYKMVVTDREDAMIGADLLSARLLFVIKEAVYKATHPVDRIFLDHHDVEVDLCAGIATTRTGHRIRFVSTNTKRLLAIAVMASSQLGPG